MDLTEPHRVLIAYGPDHVAELARGIANELRDHGLVPECVPATADVDLSHYDAVIVGGDLKGSHWDHGAERFVVHHQAQLRQRPVWMFSIPVGAHEIGPDPLPTAGVGALMMRVTARGYAVLGADRREARAWASQVAASIAVAARTPLAPVPRPRRWLLAGLCAVVGVTAIAGGAALLAHPDGSLLQIPSAMREHVPFASFAIPGLLLLVVIGLGNALAAFLTIRDRPMAEPLAIVNGAVLVLWISIQIGLEHTLHGLHVVYALAGMAIMAEAWRRRAAGQLQLAT